MTRWLFLAFVVNGCASAPAAQPDWLARCSLESETACTTYGASVPGAPPAPAAQLVVGLADRARDLPTEEAVDYWYRIEEVLEAGSQTHEIVNRRAALALASLAALDRDELAAISLEHVDEEEIDAGGDIHRRLLRRAEFAIRWGDATVQAAAAGALAGGYVAQGRLMGAISIPEGLTPVARVEFEAKRDSLAAELLAEGERLRAGLVKHCRRYELNGPECTLPATTAP